jgi:hypothetical protein
MKLITTSIIRYTKRSPLLLIIIYMSNAAGITNPKADFDRYANPLKMPAIRNQSLLSLIPFKEKKRLNSKNINASKSVQI